MLKIILEPAENGIIKKVIEDNHGGSQKKKETVTVYETDDLHNVILFCYELFEDTGIEVGNKFDKRMINIVIDWGDKYIPKEHEIDYKIRVLENELEKLKEWKNQKE